MAVIPFARSLEKISAVSARPTAASGVVLVCHPSSQSFIARTRSPL